MLGFLEKLLAPEDVPLGAAKMVTGVMWDGCSDNHAEGQGMPIKVEGWVRGQDSPYRAMCISMGVHVCMYMCVCVFVCGGAGGAGGNFVLKGKGMWGKSRELILVMDGGSWEGPVR